MEPGSEFQLEDLRDYLGVEYNPAMTIDDQRFIPGNPPIVADRRFIITNRFSTHPSVTTAGRSGSEIVMIGPGSFTVADTVPGLRTNLIINSLPSSYADLNGDYRFDDGTEVQDRYGLAAAIEWVDTDEAVDSASLDPAVDSAAPGTPEDTRQPGMRALLYGDAEMFADQVLAFPLNRFVVADGIRWLGGEEDLAGEVVSEEDVPIQHTQ